MTFNRFVLFVFLLGAYFVMRDPLISLSAFRHFSISDATFFVTRSEIALTFMLSFLVVISLFSLASKDPYSGDAELVRFYTQLSNASKVVSFLVFAYIVITMFEESRALHFRSSFLHGFASLCVASVGTLAICHKAYLQLRERVFI